MLLEHGGRAPEVDPSAWVAPNAVVSGAVRIGADARVLFGAVLSAGDGEIELGASTIVMEHAVLRGRAGAAARVGDNVIVGPHAHVNGARVGDCCFIATGASLFPGASVGAGTEVRINGVVHVASTLPEDSLVPIGWVAVGDPADVLPPAEHERIWELQEPLDFPGRVFGVERGPAREMMPEVTRRYAERFGRHRGDRPVG